MEGLARKMGLRQYVLLPLADLNDMPFKKWGIVQAIQAQYAIGDKNATLSLGINHRFPLSLPIIFLHPWDSLGVLPHVDQDGYVCYADDEGLLLDSERPMDILEWSLKRAVKLLGDQVELIAQGEIPPDFMDEFHSYWRQVVPDKNLPIGSLLKVNDRLHRIYGYIAQENSKGHYKFVAEDHQVILDFLGKDHHALKSLSRRRAIYLPLKEGTRLIPPAPCKPWNLDEVRQIIQGNITPENYRQLEKLGRKWKSQELVIVSLPRPSGGATLIGLFFNDVEGGHPLLGGQANPPEPLKIQRYDPDYLIPRGGGQMDLRRAQVLLIGCGAVGGYLALGLPQMGFGKLTLVDPDIMQAENTFRHVLGRSANGKSKVEALKEEVEHKYPYVEVRPVKYHYEEALQRGIVRLSDFDLVISASGNPTVDLFINREVHQAKSGPLTLFTWLEPYGIGGHALLTRPGKAGCFQCLYASVGDPEKGLWNRASFAEAGQSFGKDELGCGNLYTPYGALDALRTAEMAARLALDGKRCHEIGSPVISWKGPSESFESAGFQASSRFGYTPAELNEQRFSYIFPNCLVCGAPNQ
ncbi:MAG: ThiF family adenylyltransferase [Desulfuromonadaceae bacterium]|nr:ThiF family adenylyltransferase [Desulfuromonadaceae bacterium]